MPKGYKLNLSEEDYSNILKLHHEGLIDREIAEIYSIGRTTVGKILKELGVSGRCVPIKSKEQDVLELFYNGKNQTEISQELHMDIKNVRKILVSYDEDVTKNSWKRKYVVNENYFDFLDNQNKAYILGLLYADGNLTEGRYGIRIFLQERDKKLLEDILNELQSNYPLYFVDYSHKPNHQNQYGFFINNKHMYNTLLQLGLFPNKSLLLKYPKDITPDLQRHFIRGYFDGDGSMYLSKNGMQCNFIGTFDFCIAAKNIIQNTIGVNCSVYHIVQYDKNYTNDITCRLQISGGKQVQKFLSWIYDGAELYLERKYDKYYNYFVA